MRILKNRVIDRWRHSGVRRTCELREELDPPAPPDLEEPWWHALDAEEVHRAIGALPARYRQIMQLQLSGISYADAARQLGLKLPTVGTRLFRARMLLRQTLEQRREQRRTTRTNSNSPAGAVS